MTSESEKIAEAKKFIIKIFSEVYAKGGTAIIASSFYKKAHEAGLCNGGCNEPINKALEELTEPVIAFKFKGI